MYLPLCATQSAEGAPPCWGPADIGPWKQQLLLAEGRAPRGRGPGAAETSPPVHVHYPRGDSLVHNVGETYRRQEEKTAFREFKVSNWLFGKQGVSRAMKTQLKIKGIRSEARLCVHARHSWNSWEAGSLHKEVSRGLGSYTKAKRLATPLPAWWNQNGDILAQ